MEKEKHVLIRVSEEEKNKVQAMTKKDGLSLSEYARKMMLHGQVIKVDPEDKKVLNGVAINLNQLTRYFNQTEERKPELDATLKQMIDQILHAYRKR